MTPMSRRDILAGLTASGVASIVAARCEERQGPPSSNAALFSDDERRQRVDALLRYFAANAPQLLRAPAGILKHPSVAPSLPGKQYSTNLWDWDTLWTSQGLFRLAALQHDERFRQVLCEHVSRKSLELSGAHFTGWANPNHDDRGRSGPPPNHGQRFPTSRNQAKLPSSASLGCSSAINKRDARVGWH